MQCVAITDAQRAQFVRDGYIVIPGVVPDAARLRALRLINSALGKGINKEDAEKFKNGILYPELASRPEFVEMFNQTQVKSVVEQLTGTIHSAKGAQIALRFPGTLCTDKYSFIPVPFWSEGWHIDGLHSPGNQMLNTTAGKIGNFTALVGVVLSDNTEELGGNLVVYPGSHLLLEHWCNQGQNLEKLANEGESALPKLFLPKAKQVCAPAGSLMICHYMLAHSIAPNTSPNTRYVLYYRVTSISQPEGVYTPASMRSIWQDWPPLQAAARALPPIGPQVAQSSRGCVLLTEAERLFEANHWVNAWPTYQEIYLLRPDAVTTTFKGAFCGIQYAIANKSSCLMTAQKAEEMLRTARTASPGFIVIQPLLARALQLQGRHAEALAELEAMLTSVGLGSEAEKWQKDVIADALRCVVELLIALGRRAEHEGYAARFIARYPFLSTTAKAISEEEEAKALAVEGDKLMKAEPKDWVAGQKVFTRLCVLQPQIWWWQLQAAACFTYGPPATVTMGEAYAKESVRLQELSPLDVPSMAAYGILARNYAFQKKFAEALLVVQQLPKQHAAFAALGTKFPVPGQTGGELEELFILEALRVAKQAITALSRPQTELSAIHAALLKEFPLTAGKMQGVLQESNCVLQ